MKRYGILMILACCAVTTLAADTDYTRHPGYVALNDLAEMKDLQATVEVQIRKPLLELVAALNSESDPELSQLIRNLAVIQVRQFELTEAQSSDLETTFTSISGSLQKRNWERIVKVREDGEFVDVFINFNADSINGLMVMVLESREAVFVNIAGTLDAELLGRLGAQLDIPKIGDLPIAKKPAVVPDPAP